jgi:hypothetical protein
MGMIQRGPGTRLAFKAFGELFVRYFDGDDAVQPRVARLSDLTHAGTKGRQDFVGAEPGWRGERHSQGIKCMRRSRSWKRGSPRKLSNRGSTPIQMSR